MEKKPNQGMMAPDMNAVESQTGVEGLQTIHSSESAEVTMLIGTFDRKIDSKLRVGLPQQFRDCLGNHPLIMLRWLKRSLAIMPVCNWLPLAKRIASLELYTDAGLSARHQLFAYAQPINLDAEGRIVIPQDMVEYARLEKNIMMLGDWDKITIWNQSYYKDQVALDDRAITKQFPAVLQLAKGQKTIEAFEQEVRENQGNE
ncbi:MAG: hypothetical protein RBU29_00365 [bacterium]|nr:hypothetical protein [bacterium]